ncbi:MAG: HNH endonuclease signature motif containing protein [Candidatus Jorgensenbacteria bacterium]
MAGRKLSQLDLIMEFYKRNPNRDIKHPEIVDWVTKEWRKRTRAVFRDPDRGIRKLHQDGYLIKVRKGVYRYEPGSVKKRSLEDFSPEIKKAIFERDGYKCVVCGRGPKEGVEIHADHIRAKDLGGKATLENGQTLCSQHNFLKKNYGQTALGKRFFIQLYQAAKKVGDKATISFCSEVLALFDKYGLDSEFKWKK